VLNVFTDIGSINLKGFVIWLPVRPTDTLKAAQTEADQLKDPRITEFWNDDLSIDAAYMQTLKLSRTAFDTYLVYAPDAKWSKKAPPSPDFWMHQRGPQSGADQTKHLNAKRLKKAIEQLLAGH